MTIQAAYVYSFIISLYNTKPQSQHGMSVQALSLEYRNDVLTFVYIFSDMSHQSDILIRTTFIYRRTDNDNLLVFLSRH